MTKSNSSLKRHNKTFTPDDIAATIILTFSFLWFIPFLNKGIDYTDAAYNLANFNKFYSSGGTSVGMFISNLIGGTVCMLTPSHQYLIFRILYWLTYISVSLLLYFSFNKVLPKTLLASSILVGFFMIKHGTTFFAYNAISALGLALLIFVLTKAFETEKSILFFISGTIVGINTFVRLPNILQFGFIVTIIWHFGFINKKNKYAITKSLLYIFGFITGSVVCIGIYLIKNNVANLVSSTNSYVNMAANSSNSHGITKMISKFITQCISAVYVTLKHILPFLLLVAAFIYVVLFIASQIKKEKIITYKPSKIGLFILSSVIAIASIIYAVFYLNARTDYRVYMYILGLGNLILGIVCAILFLKRAPKASISTLLCACVSVVLTFGSDNVMNTLFLLFAPITIGFILCLYYIYKLGVFPNAIGRKRIINKAAKVLSLILAVVIIFSSCTIFFMQLFPFTYGPYLNGNGSILELTTDVNPEISALKGMKTTPKRAEQINEFYTVMQNEVLSSKEIAVFGYFPLAFSLCKNKNYFNSVWIDLGAVDTSSLEQTYLTKKAENNLPVIVVSYIYMNDINDTIVTPKEKSDLLNRIINENSYSTYYESENFLIYYPQSN